MGFWKFSTFLALGILFLYQMGNLQAAPFNSDSETNPGILEINQPFKENSSPILKFIKKMLGKRETQDTSIATQKRACNTATCVTNTLAYMLSKHLALSKYGFKPSKFGPNFLNHHRKNLQK